MKSVNCKSCKTVCKLTFEIVQFDAGSCGNLLYLTVIAKLCPFLTSDWLTSKNLQKLVSLSSISICVYISMRSFNNLNLDGCNP